MTTTQPADGEFALLAENAAEVGVPVGRVLPVRRVEAETPTGRVSALRWGVGPVRLVLLHGGGQNAHTWDSVLVALGVPALAVDLPGHGHSGWRQDKDYSPGTNAGTVAAALASWGVGLVPVVGMSLGGLTGIALTARYPGTATGLVVVDVTPSVLARTVGMTAQQRGTTALVAGPAEFDSLDAMVEAAAAGAPQRPRAALRRGVTHNARQLPSGRWAWRYDRQTASPEVYERLWDDLSRIDVPIALVPGGDSDFVGRADIAEFAGRQPGATVEMIPGAGHSVQSDRPRELAAFLHRFLRLG
ncbi:alpha/beta fold hydrolase [Cryptosporangium aurantiacum]|uniref:Pimeloyl-ACP methyl ester carboxylesterase n=1 Tax=Cryptosporangium aurantiacum TaxID=134849 RepID=A0A1M7R4G2_9ACTN|nr:alpha/beta hydrolase [Cryptosporangium aurantiacum]SHN39845.1 Pimeloyl-ACP methyl ester carboxylesterase [Cryptosporangium aurantiacum]